jgi:hypothetical protein
LHLDRSAGMLLRETQNLEKDFRPIARKTNPKPTAPPAGARLNSLTGR